MADNATQFRFLDLPKDICLLVDEQLPITTKHAKIPVKGDNQRISYAPLQFSYSTARSDYIQHTGTDHIAIQSTIDDIEAAYVPTWYFEVWKSTNNALSSNSYL
ncbi:hypothetical protein CC80DRAFT_547569 [Byssothecium circinans]|uniref:Uncharacterized protein n=1 Tax=Byssothecium circinans TaxID=147558 RepID=A0A6A5TYH1_9PLEO|nr:hypothetical protein CC80DRAFT_547569 [Byssothecium circinans]